MLTIQDEQSRFIYFIKSGLVKITRKLCFLPRKMYYKKVGDYGSMVNLTQEEAKEMFRIEPLNLDFKLIGKNEFKAHY